MTNADKYLKDGVENIESLIKDFFDFIGCVEDSNRYNNIYQFFLNEAKPTLTEDEKVILKLASKKQHETIKRSEYNNLFIANVSIASLFGEDLFQFIKPRRRI